MRRELTSTHAFIYGIAGLLSIAISFLISQQSWVINNDAVCYLQSAAMMSQGLHNAMAICGQAKTPFYSGLIALINHLSHFSYLNAAYILNGFFSLLTAMAFIGIVGLLNRNPLNQGRMLILAAAVVLLSHELNAVKSFIVRDHGYWAFYLISIYCLIRFSQNFTWFFALSWSFAMMLATLFRVEGVLFLMLLPVIMFFHSAPSFAARLKRFMQLNLLTMLILLAGIIWFIAHPESFHSSRRLHELHFQLVSGPMFLAQRYYWQGNALIDHVLGHGSPIAGAYLLFITLSVWYVTLLVSHISIIYTFLIGFAWFKKCLTKQFVLRAYILINLLITLVFLGENMFLSRRYLVALSMTLMIWIPFALDYILQLKRKWVVVTIAIFFMLSAIGGLVDFGYSKKYIYNAGQWIAKNIPKEASLYSNDFQLMYYSDHFGPTIFAKGKEYSDLNISKIMKQGKKYDYFAMVVTKKFMRKNYKEYLYLKTLQPMIVFKNKRNDQVMIFKNDTARVIPEKAEIS